MRFRTLEEMESAKGRQTNSIQKEGRRQGSGGSSVSREESV